MSNGRGIITCGQRSIGLLGQQQRALATQCHAPRAQLFDVGCAQLQRGTDGGGGLFGLLLCLQCRHPQQGPCALFRLLPERLLGLAGRLSHPPGVIGRVRLGGQRVGLLPAAVCGAADRTRWGCRARTFASGCRATCSGDSRQRRQGRIFHPRVQRTPRLLLRFCTTPEFLQRIDLQQAQPHHVRAQPDRFSGLLVRRSVVTTLIGGKRLFGDTVGSSRQWQLRIGLGLYRYAGRGQRHGNDGGQQRGLHAGKAPGGGDCSVAARRRCSCMAWATASSVVMPCLTR